MKLPVFTLLLLLIMSLSCNRKDLAMFNPATYFPEESKGEKVTFLPNTAPENVFANLMICYNHRDIRHYDSLLAPDYRFYMSLTLKGFFNENNQTPDPGQWTPDIYDSSGHSLTAYYMTREQDLESVRRMFDPAGQAKDISLFFQASADLVGPDSAFFRVTNIELKVTLRTNVTYTATDQIGGTYMPAPSRVILVRNTEGCWQITRWFDGTTGEGDQQ